MNDPWLIVAQEQKENNAYLASWIATVESFGPLFKEIPEKGQETLLISKEPNFSREPRAPIASRTFEEGRYERNNPSQRENRDNGTWGSNFDEPESLRRNESYGSRRPDRGNYRPRSRERESDFNQRDSERSGYDRYNQRGGYRNRGNHGDRAGSDMAGQYDRDPRRERDDRERRDNWGKRGDGRPYQRDDRDIRRDDRRDDRRDSGRDDRRDGGRDDRRDYRREDRREDRRDDRRDDRIDDRRERDDYYRANRDRPDWREQKYSRDDDRERPRLDGENFEERKDRYRDNPENYGDRY
ncbi:hypothetical protein SteCoe_39395 [Stentor coeruleus]|uniref:Uncharacterized protein n=1 Tax=Stentor coeruleus TaxID=5963 RepID=A0A1R2AKR3_9CILI|nr:hypothetical protein SteCoe_39395 [Stentor coeruleus]